VAKGGNIPLKLSGILVSPRAFNKFI